MKLRRFSRSAAGLAAAAAAVLLVFGPFVQRAYSQQGEAAGTPDQISQGRELFLENCASCHGAGAKGNGPMADSLKLAPPDLTMMGTRPGGAFNAAKIREIVEGRRDVKAHGSRDMPVWGNEFARGRKRGEGREAAVRTRVHALVAYLESIQAPKR